MYPYRVFISYSHDDSHLAEKLRTHLLEIGACPLSDVDIGVSYPFNEEIRRKISFAHIFIVLLTRNSKNRPWVHQEIGYAMGLRVPILPLALDELPEGMSEGIHALKVNPELEDLNLQLTASVLDKVVSLSQEAATAMFECADLIYERTRILVENANAIKRDYGLTKIRQRMAFSSFSIPDRSINHTDWDEREGYEKRSPETRKLLQKERKIMEEHSRQAGCDLILDPYVRSSSTISGRTLAPILKRLNILLDFLESMPDDKVRVVFQKGKIEGGIHIVGDWFTAEAVVPYHKGGFKQTIFTRHAPSVLAKIDSFDEEFEDILRDTNLIRSSSRKAAIRELKEIIENITKEIAETS